MKIYTNLNPLIPQFGVESIYNGDINNLLRESGFDGIEINSIFFELIDFLKNKINLKQTSLHSNFTDFNLASVNPYMREGSLKQLNDEISFCRNNNIGTLTFHPGRVKKIDRNKAFNLLQGSLRTIFSTYKDDGPLLCIENMDHTVDKLCNNEEELQDLFDEFPLLNLTLDFAHLAMTGSDIDSFLTLFEKKIAHIHISGYNQGIPHSKVSLVESTINLIPYLGVFSERDIVVVIENRSWDKCLASLKEIKSIYT